MVGMNNKNNSKDKSSLFQKIHKIINSATVFALLFPSISSIGLVQAAEEETEDPPVEEVVPQSESETEDINIDPEVEDNDLDSETEDKNSDIETSLPEEKNPDTSQVSEEPHNDVTDSTTDVTEETQVDKTSEDNTKKTQEELEVINDNIPTMQATGIIQENLVYESGKISLINQEPNINIAAVLPNGNVIYKIVPYHGTWQPNQTIAPNKV